MRTVENMKLDGSNVHFTLDHKATPEETLAAANKILRRQGLEFVRHETGNDQCAFSLQTKRVG